MEVYVELNQSIRTSSQANAKTGNITSRVPIYCPPKFDVESYVRSLTEMIEQRFDDGWSVYLVTVMSSRISQDKRSIPTLVHDPVKSMYTRFITRTVRRPRTKFGMGNKAVPILIGSADLPVYKRLPVRSVSRDPNVVGGLHFHGLLAIPSNTRLADQSVQEHFEKNDRNYRRGLGIERIDIAPVEPGTIPKVMRYCLKAICRRTIGFDEGILILPRASSELTD